MLSTQKTKNTFRGRIFDRFGINRYFHKISVIGEILGDDHDIISPVEAKVQYIWKIKENGKLEWKSKKKVDLYEMFGEHAEKFLWWKYITFYLSPKNKHFRITPHDGVFTYTALHDGKTHFPVIVWLEKIYSKIPFLKNKDLLEKAIRKNATISSILETTNGGNIGLIAIGSLNVNRIHIMYEENKRYPKWTPVGYFSLGSSMILLLPKNTQIHVQKKDTVKIGQVIGTYSIF